MAFALCGLLLLIWRLFPRAPFSRTSDVGAWPRVSIIVPARDEEKVLARLLTSLLALDYPDYEIIVVDDCSSDQTAAIAQSFSVTVVSGRERPLDWRGKQWACQQGFEHARGELLLFTDADTWHARDSLRRAVRALLDGGADGLSALPYHQGRRFWERLCGPFHCLLIALTAPYGNPSPKRVFAIGQYLLFRRNFYQKMGAHRSVRHKTAEDIAIAQRLLASGGQWLVARGKPFFTVRMYEDLGDFLKGWRRNFRAGLADSHPLSALEATLFIAALTGSFQLSPVTALISIGSLAFLAFAQKRLGHFSILGLLLFPFSLALFILVTVLALYDELRRSPVSWKNRDYTPKNAQILSDIP